MNICCKSFANATGNGKLCYSAGCKGLFGDVNVVPVECTRSLGWWWRAPFRCSRPQPTQILLTRKQRMRTTAQVHLRAWTCTMHGMIVYPFCHHAKSTTAFCSDHGLPFAPLAHMTTAAAVAEAQEASDEVRFWKQTCFVKTWFPSLVLLCVGGDLSRLVFGERYVWPGWEQLGGQFPWGLRREIMQQHGVNSHIPSL